MKKFVGIASDGFEYLYLIRSAHHVPIAKAKQICDTLNRARYKLRNGEKWHVYNDESDNIIARSQSFTFRSGKLVELCYYDIKGR